MTICRIQWCCWSTIMSHVVYCHSAKSIILKAFCWKHSAESILRKAFCWKHSRNVIHHVTSLNVILLNVVLLNVILLNVILLNAVPLNVILLITFCLLMKDTNKYISAQSSALKVIQKSVVQLNVAAPFYLFALVKRRWYLAQILTKERKLIICCNCSDEMIVGK